MLRDGATLLYWDKYQDKADSSKRKVNWTAKKNKRLILGKWFVNSFSFIKYLACFLLLIL